MTTFVAARLTPSDASTVAGALIYAYKKLRGAAPPSQESWLYPLALSALETAHWTQLYNHNLGNVTSGVCHGKITGDAGVYRNPHVTIDLHFAAFWSLAGGSLALIGTLDCMGAQAHADEGDYSGFMNALQTGGYVGGDAYPSLAATIDSLKNTRPNLYIPPMTRFAIAASAAGIVAWGYHEGLLQSAWRRWSRAVG